MREGALAVLVCPGCHGPLRAKGFSGASFENGHLICAGESIEYEVVDGIPHLIRRDRAPDVTAFAQDFARVWRQDGWAPRTPAEVLALPRRSPRGRGNMKWRVKARSMDALLSSIGSSLRGRAADLGAGTGWLSHHLAVRGLEVYAVDILTDSGMGLNTAGIHVRAGPYFERVCAELEVLPFRDRGLNLVICNASLHYAASLDRALEEIDRVLNVGGRLVVMNSPVHGDSASARRAEGDFRRHLRDLGASLPMSSDYHHFVRESLVRALADRVGHVSEVSYDPGLPFRWIRRAKGLALRMELASFPIFIAEKRSVEGTGVGLSGKVAPLGRDPGKAANTNA